MTYTVTRRSRAVGAAVAALLVAASLALAGCGSGAAATSQSGTLNGSEVEFSLANLDKGAQGLFTSLHCIAMCGGLNLSQSLVYATETRHPSGAAPSSRASHKKKALQALRPNALYNLG